MKVDTDDSVFRVRVVRTTTSGATTIAASVRACGMWHNDEKTLLGKQANYINALAVTISSIFEPAGPTLGELFFHCG
jgi:hypothetical protein